jgi:hypothetical protein
MRAAAERNGHSCAPWRVRDRDRRNTPIEAAADPAGAERPTARRTAGPSVDVHHRTSR